MTPEVTKELRDHELRVIDEVVRGGGGVKPEDAELVDFALLVRSARPVPDHGAVRRLDERLATTRTRKRGAQGPRWALAAALASLVLVVGAVGINSDQLSDRLNGQDDAALLVTDELDESSGLPSAGGTASSRAAAPELEKYLMSPQSQGAAAIGTEPGRESGVTGGTERRTERTARVSIAATPQKFDRAADRITEIAGEFGGYVQSSSVRVNDRDRSRGDFMLMIPAAKYGEAVAAVSKLGHVRSRSDNVNDVTTEFNAVERSLETRRDRVRSLTAQLRAASEPAEIASLERRLRRARAAERQAEQAQRAMNARVNYMPLEVKLSVDKAADTAGKGPIAKAWSTALDILVGIVAVLIVGLAVLLPVAAVSAVTWWLLRRLRRSRADRVVAEAAAQAE